MILQWSELIRLSMLEELEVRGLSVSKSQSVGGGIQYSNAIGVLSEVVWFPISAVSLDIQILSGVSR